MQILHRQTFLVSHFHHPCATKFNYTVFSEKVRSIISIWVKKKLIFGHKVDLNIYEYHDTDVLNV